MDRSCKITTNGLAVIAACMAKGAVLDLSRAAVGSGTVPEGTDLRDVHALYEAVADCAVGERIRSGNSLRTSVQYSNKAHPEQEKFTLTEFMLYAVDPETGEETDFVYGALGDFAQPVPKYDESQPESVFTYPMILSISSDLAVKVSAVPGIVTYADLEAMMTSGYLGTVKAEIKIPAEKWTRDIEPEINACPLHADVELDGLTGEEIPTVTFHDPMAARTVAAVARTMPGVLRLYAVTAPAGELTATASISAGPERVGKTDMHLPWELEPATMTTLGAVMPGEDFIVDAQGRLSLNPERVLTPDAIAPEADVEQDISRILEN